ncbi:hypothetical protein ACH5A2_23255 [Streptomyces collinus]|uniref:hypothetical protein n=1 Tax=Streptomyces collinus TaxID=42684 RepID=UPI0037917048
MELHGIRKRYGRGRTAVHALRGVDLTSSRCAWPATAPTAALLVAVAGIALGTAIALAAVTLPARAALRGETLER